MVRPAAIYARVSTADQNCQRQVADLTEFAERCGYDVVGVFQETASGASTKRKVRKQVIALAQARKIEAILVTELSRWGRSTRDLLETLEKLSAWKVSVVAMHGLTFELGTPHGRMMATLLAGIAQLGLYAQVRREVAYLDALSAAAGMGMKDIDRLTLAKRQLKRRAVGKRSTSSLPVAIELLLSRPIVSAPMISKAARVSQRGALNLVSEPACAR